MLDRTRVLVTIAACMSAIPVAAQAPAPTTTAFDGTYVGVSRTLQGKMEGRNAQGCSLNPQPGLLTIAGGVARYPSAAWMPGSRPGGGAWEGSVNGQGVLVMRGQSGNRIDAQIDGRGTVTGRSTVGCSHQMDCCSYQMVWQKQGK
jgi:hypothetical protein